MSETFDNNPVRGQRVFVSYSRADRQRVEGLATLLQALQHEVFMDVRSILPGMRWREKLEQALGKADVMLVFWTRYAERSKWVRREYETFAARFPDRPLVPVLGDTSPLTGELESRQHADFLPLINELFATVRDLEEKGVSKREIRKVILKRLEDEGIELPPDNRNRLFGLFGVLGLTTAPLHFLYLARDLLADHAAAVPTSYYYTAAGAAAASLIVCHGLSGDGNGILADGRIIAPDLFQAQVNENQSGSEACEEEDMICVSMSRSTISDIDGKFFGYSTPTCSAIVVRQAECKVQNTNFALQGIIVKRSPEAHEGVADLSGSNFFCMRRGKGPQGVYEFANCVKP